MNSSIFPYFAGNRQPQALETNLAAHVFSTPPQLAVRSPFVRRSFAVRSPFVRRSFAVRSPFVRRSFAEEKVTATLRCDVTPVASESSSESIVFVRRGHPQKQMASLIRAKTQAHIMFLADDVHQPEQREPVRLARVLDGRYICAIRK